jgi:uncharacterized protein YukJ
MFKKQKKPGFEINIYLTSENGDPILINRKKMEFIGRERVASQNDVNELLKKYPNHSIMIPGIYYQGGKGWVECHSTDDFYEGFLEVGWSRSYLWISLMPKY